MEHSRQNGPPFFWKTGIDSIDILNNNFYEYGAGGEYAVCGTRGWFFEEEKGGEHDEKIMRREVMRLEASLNAAGTEKSWYSSIIRLFFRDIAAARYLNF